MITVSQIRNGGGYMRNHLSANDYYSESEKVAGQWHGKAAKILGLEGKEVCDQTFEALRTNRHPETGERLTPRRPKVAFHDFVISAPKSTSIAAMVGGDDRIVEAFDRCVLRAFQRLESCAAVRVRTGIAYHTESVRQTGNAAAAIFRHDTSRLLDPQLHTHIVFANVSWDEESGRWLALQPKRMAEESKEWIRAEFYKELADECRALGYAIEADGEAFRFSGIDRSTEHAFSQRAVQRDRFEERYQNVFGNPPDNKRVEHFIKDHKAAATRRFKEEFASAFGTEPTDKVVTDFVQDWRSSKMQRSTRSQVEALQQSRLSQDQALALERACEAAMAQTIGESPTIAADEPAEKQSHSSGDAATFNPNHSTKRSLRARPKAAHKRKARALKKLPRIAAALGSHPTKLMAQRVQQLARRKHGYRRRVG